MSKPRRLENQRLAGRFTDWWPPLLVLLFLASTWVTIVRRAENDERRVIQDAMLNHSNVALSIMNHTSQLLDRFRFYANVLIDSADRESSDALIAAAIKRDKSFLQLMRFDAKGKLRYTTGRQPAPWLLEEARRFAVMPTADPEKQIVVGRTPPTDSTHAVALPLFYRPPSDGNRGDDFVVALIGLDDFSLAFRGIALGPSGEIVVVASDGRELMRVREGLLESTFDIAGSQRLAAAFLGVSGKLTENGDYSEERLYAFHRVELSPLAVLVSRTRADVLTKATTIQRRYFSSALQLTGLMLFLVILWMWLATRRRGLVGDLTLAQENNARLIAQIEKEKDLAFRLATHDQLTGLPNRLLFAELGARHARRAERLRGQFAVFFIDLDRFKPINDTFGHKAGDQVLSEVARRLLENMRQVDVVSRYGGDEFIALVSDLRNSQDAALIARKMISNLSRPIHGIVDGELRITPSIGIAFYPQDSDSIESLVRQADAAMYRAKEKGRATFAFADPVLNRRIELSNLIEAALPAAIANREIQVHFQPKVSLADFRITGLEALARWTHPQLGVISPADFIPVAEQCGAIVELGEYIVLAVCKQLQQWSRDHVPLVPVAVNVSPRQLCSPRLVDHVILALADCGVAAKYFEIEITETGLIDSDEGYLDILHRLDALGIRLAIDDFGTGYSGLGRLRNTPFSVVKIDRSFIKDIRNDLNDAAIVSNTISLANSLKLTTIAEGVETVEQVLHLKAAHCDQAQGFFFSKPLCAAEVTPLLIAGQIAVNTENKQRAVA